MGVQNTLYRTQEQQYEKYSKLSTCQIEKKYVWDKFRVGKKVKKDVWRHSYLMKETLAQDNCEIIDYIWLMMEGHTGTRCSRDLNTCEKETKCLEINNYIVEKAQWKKIEW